ncbi:DUF3311 domain-containing protein [Pseudonocardia spinosispora]|uniref:DUF3311 domain-containing protein n=1 Tax=Pseudonocardia spinosispora TaxID=103441 RepID=UPI001B7F919E|nr:DUF3311 domain-containing protein [Pseudonocardia spinosispora]
MTMASVPTPRGRPGPPSRSLPSNPRLLSLCLLAPCVAVLCVPLYAGASPSLLGVPFFYWYQLAWALISPLLLVVAYAGFNRPRAIGAA